MNPKLFLWVVLATGATIAGSATTTAMVASADVFHWDVVIAALVTGLFGTVQIYMLSKLHTMVNSQQSELNRLSQIAEREAAYTKGLLQGGSIERTRTEELTREAATKVSDTAIAAAAVLKGDKSPS